jgi:hypothetical protein
MQFKIIIPLKMPKAHAAGVFNDLVSSKKATAQILCGGLFALQQQKTLPARSRQRKNTKGKTR